MTGKSSNHLYCNFPISPSFVTIRDRIKNVLYLRQTINEPIFVEKLKGVVRRNRITNIFKNLSLKQQLIHEAFTVNSKNLVLKNQTWQSEIWYSLKHLTLQLRVVFIIPTMLQIKRAFDSFITLIIVKKPQ